MRDNHDDTNEVILDDEKRTLPVRPIPREEPPTPLPAPPGVPRTPSGELLLRLRAPSEAPPDPVQARLDLWGEAIVATVQEAKAEATAATTHAARASKENLAQDAAITQIVTDVAEVKTDVATIKKENAQGLQLVQTVVSQLTAKWPAAAQAAATAIATAALGAFYAWAKAKGWLP